jgi:DNA-directed RNA polymerase specialized sigma24 family protein
MNTAVTSRDHALLSDAGSPALDRIGLDVYLSAVASTRGFLIRELMAAGLANEVDAVHQRVREVAWLRAETFDASRGTFGAFVQGIAWRVASEAVKASRRAPTLIELREDSAWSTASTLDPLQSMVSAFEQKRLLAYVADAAGERDWAIAVAFALDENSTSEQIGDLHDVSARKARATRVWVTQIACAARTALRCAEEGLGPDRQTLLDCIPAGDGLREIAVFVPSLEHDTELIARATGLSLGRIRSRVAKTRRLLKLAQTILTTEGS